MPIVREIQVSESKSFFLFDSNADIKVDEGVKQDEKFLDSVKRRTRNTFGTLLQGLYLRFWVEIFFDVELEMNLLI